MLSVLKKGAISLGTHYVNGEVVKFNFSNKHDIVIDGVEEEYESTDELVVSYKHFEMNYFKFNFLQGEICKWSPKHSFIFLCNNCGRTVFWTSR